MTFVAAVARSYLGYDPVEAGRASEVVCLDKSLTVQSDADEADINVLVERLGLGYQTPPGVFIPSYGDYTDVRDFQSAMNAVRYASEAFMLLPADTRARFNNDPEALLQFCSDEKNLDEAVRLGLAVKKPEPVKPAPIEVVDVTPTPPPPK
ncbi:MAG: internal scaffolding protein [Microviridae sp.]|nr:MAG: internal scaffolding protein [Microviridae sp.]